MSLGQYLLGVGELGLASAAVCYGGWRLRNRLLPEWTGPQARLAELILALCLLTWVAELLGVIGLFKPIPVLLGCVFAGLLAAWLGSGAGIRRPREHQAAAASTVVEGATGSPETGPGTRAWRWIALAVVGLVFAGWAERTLLNLDRGMVGFDTLWYHMPFAARFVQEGSIASLHFTDPLYLNWFYPQNSELLHGVGIALFRHHDVLSPLVNLGFLGLALLAAWCAGRAFGRGPLALVAVAVVLDAQVLVSRAGEANNDIVGLAFFLSAVALLLNRGWGQRQGALLIAALAAGLAVGTKLTLLAPVGLLTLGVIAVSPHGRRFPAAVVWLGGLAATGGFWYLRNLFTVGNPLPWVDFGFLPSPERLLNGRPDFSVAHYLTESEIWSQWFVPGLEDGLGALWFLPLGLAVAGVVLTVLRREDRVRPMLALVAAAGAIAYLFTPLSASGPEGEPVGFAINLRYVTPALCLGLILIAIHPALGRRGSNAVLAALLATLLIGDDPFAFLDGRFVGGAIAIGILAAVVPPTLKTLHGLARPGSRSSAFLAGLVVLGAALLVQGYRVQDDYLRGRYAHPQEKFGLGIGFTLARDLRDERIGIAGTSAAFVQYGLYGTDLTNRVQYIGREGPNGSFSPILDCRDWRLAVNAGGYTYLVTSPSFRFQAPDQPAGSPERSWLANDPVAELVREGGRVAIFRINGPLSPVRCPAKARRFPLKREQREEKLSTEDLPAR